jgi:hypothetical protein
MPHLKIIITCFKDYLCLCYKGFMWLVTQSHCTQSPFVPRLSWLAHCSRWTSYRLQVGFIGFTHTLHHLFICIWGVKYILIQLSKQKSYSHNRKENSYSFPPDIMSLFLLTTLYTTSFILFTYLTASISHPIPLSAANPFCIYISV